MRPVTIAEILSEIKESPAPASRPRVSRRGIQRRRAAAAVHKLAQTVCEDLLAFQMTASGVPAFERQLQFIDGRKFTADFAWRAYSLVVEVQGGIWRRGGGAHSHPSNLLRDVEKAQLAVINGWSTFPVTTDEVRNGQALKFIELALRAKGWKP
jgi:very-short-patch-repair endonuclease